MATRAKTRPLLQALEDKDDEAIAQFFEQHDPLQFVEELEPAESEATASPLVPVNFRLPENALQAIGWSSIGDWVHDLDPSLGDGEAL